MPMIVITTSNSTSVKPRRADLRFPRRFETKNVLTLLTNSPPNDSPPILILMSPHRPLAHIPEEENGE
jgi:hypothetical protein